MNELSNVDKEKLSVIEKNKISEIIKPLTNEIHLFDTFIAGTSYIEDKNIFTNLKVGEELILIRENNKFDDNAILVKKTTKEKLGYIPEKDNVIFSRLLDAGKLLKAKVNSVEKQGSMYKVAIGVYLFDF